MAVRPSVRRSSRLRTVSGRQCRGWGSSPTIDVGFFCVFRFSVVVLKPRKPILNSENGYVFYTRTHRRNSLRNHQKLMTSEDVEYDFLWDMFVQYCENGQKKCFAEYRGYNFIFMRTHPITVLKAAPVVTSPITLILG